MGLKIGKKYNKDYSTDEIIGFIDKDIQEAIKNGEVASFKYHIDKNKEYPLSAPTLVIKVLSISKPFAEFGKNGYTEEFKNFEKKINEIGKAYKKTDMDARSDYFQTNYYFEIEYSDKVFND